MITAIMVAYGARMMHPEQHPRLYVPLELYVDLFPEPILFVLLFTFNVFIIADHYSILNNSLCIYPLTIL